MSAFDEIREGLQEAVAHARGETGDVTLHRPDVRAIRKLTGLSQVEFARRCRISVSTLRHWEQGDRVPQGPARSLLELVRRDPGAVLDGLAPTEGTRR